MLINVLGFNLLWIGLVYWGNSFIAVAMPVLAVHVALVSQRRKELLLMLVVASFGICVDSILQYFGFYIFGEQQHIPLWLMALWFCFSATLAHSLNFLSTSKMLQALTGGIFAPLSYIAGYKLGAVAFGQSLLSTYLILSIIWAFLFLLFFFIKGLIYEKHIR